MSCIKKGSDVLYNKEVLLCEYINNSFLLIHVLHKGSAWSMP